MKTAVYMIPYAGGVASRFLAWKKYLPSFIEIVPIDTLSIFKNLAERAVEPTVISLAEAVAEQVRQLSSERYVIFGHSMGALLGYEAVRILQRDRMGSPMMFIASGCLPPHKGRDDLQIGHLSDNEFDAALLKLGGVHHEVLKNRDLIEVLRPRLREEVRACQNYKFMTGEPVSCSVEVWGGENDVSVSYGDLRDWRGLCGGSFRTRVFPGNHLFIEKDVELSASRLGQAILEQAQCLV